MGRRGARGGRAAALRGPGRGRPGARPHAAVAGNAPRPAGAPATAAAETGFAGQAPLTRWFTHTYGITPAAYRTA
ncbi:hypothetical protein [Streptomyces omiyaensis]|uniref:hypothetical protein n=1 Tax=Streptomyces omiyaensis TaxID=68247 RepID=UPI0036FCED8B